MRQTGLGGTHAIVSDRTVGEGRAGIEFGHGLQTLRDARGTSAFFEQAHESSQVGDGHVQLYAFAADVERG